MALLCLAALPALAQERPKNVIVFIADGCGAEQYTLARWVKGAPLALDSIQVGAVKTFIADSVIADSAPAASAYATGCRTSDKFISTGPKPGSVPGIPAPLPGVALRPLATVLEGARLQGKATGVVATVQISHATPAAYLAHSSARDAEEDLMEQAVHQNADVVLGGGRQYLLPVAQGGLRRDGDNLLHVLAARGYQIISKRQELSRVSRGKVFGLFAGRQMAPEIDRPALAPEQPTLEEMTRAALRLLSQAPGGFFLMVEGSQIDWAGHANDPAHLVSDLLMFDRAVAAGLEFARRDGQTLVLALSDHNTGGLAIGNAATSGSYSQLAPTALLAPLKTLRCSAAALWQHLDDQPTPQELQAVLQHWWGWQVSREDAAQVLALARRYPKAPHYALGEFLCPRYTALGWTTHGHTGGDVPLFAQGPGQPQGLLDAPQIGQLTAAALDLDLSRLTGRLLVDAAQAFPGGRVTLEQPTPHNFVVRITRHGQTALLPVNRNLLQWDGRTHTLEGVVVHIPATGRVYLPRQAVQLITGDSSPLPNFLRSPSGQ